MKTTIAIIVLCILSLTGYATFAIGAGINSNKFYQVVSEKKVLFPALILAYACQIAAIIIGFVEVF